VDKVRSELLGWILLAASCAAFAAGAPKVELGNPGFEEVEKKDGRVLPSGWSNRFEMKAWWGDVLPEGWANSEDRMRHIEASPAAAKSGKYGLLMKASGGPRLWVEQEVTFPPGSLWWRIAVNARGEADGLSWAQIWVKYGNRRWAASHEVLLSKDWREIALVCRSAPRATLRLIAWVPGCDVHFDDLRIERVDTPKDLERGARQIVEPGPSGRAEFMKQASPTLPGEIFVERPTCRAIGFEWNIRGDFNRNGEVGVEYRKTSEQTWHPGQTMLRLMWEGLQLDGKLDRVCPNMYAGSVLDLEPGTEHEVRLTLADPDGGGAVRTFKSSTRSIPGIYDGLRTLHVYPPKSGGRKREPSFEGLKAAYSEARPGDVILVHAGFYVVPGEDLDMGRAYALDKKGTAEKPIVIRGANDGPAVFDGKYRVTKGPGRIGVLTGYPTTLFDLTGADHHHIENLVMRHAETCIRASQSTGLVVRGCFIEPAIGFGIGMTDHTARDYTITDNVFMNHL